MRLWGVPGTTRVSFSLSLSNSFHPAGNIPTTTSRLNSPSLCNRSGNKIRIVQESMNNFNVVKTSTFKQRKPQIKMYLISLFSFYLRAKMKNGEYESLEQIDADLSLMFENAKRYNMPNSSIYKRAFRLQQIVQVCVHDWFFVNVFIFFLRHVKQFADLSL